MSQFVGEQALQHMIDASVQCMNCGLCQKSTRYAAKQLPMIGSANPDILVVLPALSVGDATAGHLMSEPSEWHLVLGALATAFDCTTDEIEPRVAVTALVRCPASGEEPWKVDAKAKQHCGDWLKALVAHVKPKFILGVGGTADSSVFTALGEDHVGRGRVRIISAPVEMPSLKGKTLDYGYEPAIMNTHAPRVVLLTPQKAEDFYHDLAKIPRALAGEYPSKDIFAGRNYQIAQSADQAVQILQYFAALPRFSFDIETAPAGHALDPWSDHFKILGVSLADPQRNSYFIPLHHKDNPYLSQLDQKVLPELRTTMLSPAEKSAHNGAGFDMLAFATKLGYRVRNYHFDTMLAHGLIDENSQHTLKRLAELYTDLEYYDEELVDQFKGLRDEDGTLVTRAKRDYEKHMSLHILGMYACADADATEQLRLKFEAELGNRGQLNYFYNMTMPDARSVVETELFGVALDTDHHSAMSLDFETKLTEATNAIFASPEHASWVRAQQAEHLKKGSLFTVLSACRTQRFVWWSYDDYTREPTTPTMVIDADTREMIQKPSAEALERLKKLKVMLKSGARVTKGRNPFYEYSDLVLKLNSNKDLPKFLFDQRFCGLEVEKLTETGNPSTDKEALQALGKHSAVPAAIGDYRTWSRNVSSYTRPFVQGEYTYYNAKGNLVTGTGYVRDDGLMHPIYMMTGMDRGQGGKSGSTKSGFDEKSAAKGDRLGGTKTGRKSASSPPIQIMKSRGDGAKEVKKLIRTQWDDGGALLQFDFSQLELRVFALIANISWMKDAYARGADLHAELAMEVFNATYEEVMANGGFLRALAKSFWFGPIYGEGAGGMARDLQTKGLDITQEEAQARLDSMYAKMPEFTAFENDVKRQLDAGLFVTTVTGRRRTIPTWVSSQKWLRSKALRQAINTCVQSVGSDMCSWVWYTLNQWFEKMRMKARVGISVHDSVIADCPRGELAITSVAVNYLMQNVPFQFLQGSSVPIIGDGEAGRSWGTQADLTKTLASSDKVDANELSFRVGAELTPFIDTGYEPLPTWEDQLSEHSHLDWIKEKCSTIVL